MNTKGRPSRYRENEVIQFKRDYGIFKKGDTAVIKDGRKYKNSKRNFEIYVIGIDNIEQLVLTNSIKPLKK